MTEKSPSIEKENRPIINYEEFIHREKSEFYTSGYGGPNYNNFYLFFIDEPGNNRRSGRKFEWLRRLIEENPELERELTDTLTQAAKEHRRHEALKQLEPKLYEAYLIMRKCVQDDEDLFR